jgi:hypothetical protein
MPARCGELLHQVSGFSQQGLQGVDEVILRSGQAFTVAGAPGNVTLRASLRDKYISDVGVVLGDLGVDAALDVKPCS